MDTFTFLFSQTNVDKLHLRYTEEIMKGALKAEDLTFVDSKSTFKTLHKLHPQLKVCQTEPLLAANLYVLSSPNNLSALENLLSIWKRPELSAVSPSSPTCPPRGIEESHADNTANFNLLTRKSGNRRFKTSLPDSPRRLQQIFKPCSDHINQNRSTMLQKNLPLFIAKWFCAQSAGSDRISG